MTVRNHTHGPINLAVAMALVSVISTAPGAARAAEFLGTTDNNWFEATNWSDGLVPNSTRTAALQGGHAVTATSADAGGASVEASVLTIGSDGSGGPTDTLTSEVDIVTDATVQIGNVRLIQGDMNGHLTVNNADLQVGAFLEVGLNSESSSSTGTGSVAVTNGSLGLNANGLGGGGLQIGSAFQGGGDGTGTLSVTNGNITDDTVAPWQIGTALQSSPGVGRGSLRLENGTLSHSGGSVFIGSASSGTGGAEGELRLIDSEGDLGDVFVANGDNTTGLLSLEQSLLSVDDLRVLGDGSTLAFGLGGSTRAAAGTVGAGTYGALDVDNTGIVIGLNGKLSVSFDFTPAPDTLIFDLIALADGSTFSGGFDQIDYIGLPNGYNVQHQIIAAAGGNGEIFRITATTVPVPATAALTLLGLAGIGSLRRWRRGQKRDGAAAG